MRQGTGYAYDNGEDCLISYKCEGCGQRVRVTPAQAPYVRGSVTACSRVCVLHAHTLRAQRERLSLGAKGASEGAAPALGVQDGAARGQYRARPHIVDDTMP